MEISNFLAYVWGIFLIVVPLSLLINPKQIKNLFLMVENEAKAYYSGIISFLVGIITILLNGGWAYSWKALIAVLGLLAIVKGCFLLFWPEQGVKFYNSIKDKEWIFYLLFAAVFVGLFAVYFGFFGK